MAAAKIFGVEILNEGSGIFDDAVSEMQATFVARAIEPMQAVPGKFAEKIVKVELYTPGENRILPFRTPSQSTTQKLEILN